MVNADGGPFCGLWQEDEAQRIARKIQKLRWAYGREKIGSGEHAAWNVERATHPVAEGQRYSSPTVLLQASGAASSKRVWRARKTKFILPVGPLRCLAMINSALARSSSGMSVL